MTYFTRFAHLLKGDPDQPRDERGRWTTGSGEPGPSGADGLLLAADNRRQNKQVRDIVVQLGLTPDQQDQLHRAISGQGLTFQEILREAREMFNK
ncbi:MAG: hypothetical protein U1E21_01075 [Reyranellaceae bacterium]